MIDNVTKYAKQGVPAESLAQFFLKEYFADKTIEFPLNPFQMLTDIGVPFIFRPFNKYEGIYIPAADEEDLPVVGINLKRPITRQRFTAAHELCHHIKDSHDGCMCLFNSQSTIERYAEDFAAELLMPSKEFKRQVSLYEKGGYVDFDGVLKVADYFGVSFKSCLNKIAYRLHKIKGDTIPKELDKKVNKYKPAKKRKEFGYNDVLLFEQLFDAIGERFDIVATPFACQKFKNEYIYFDSRMEGVDIDQETAAAIVMDIREYKKESIYCSEENKNIVEVAGLTIAYDYAFEEADSEMNIYDAKHINERLFSTAPYPEMGGRYRESNTLVLGAKFETIEYQDIPLSMMELDKDIQKILEKLETLEYSKYVEAIVRIHHRLTVIHAFRDGNGRTFRAFLNMFFLKKHIPPVFFKDNEKNIYKDALAVVDTTGDYSELYEVFFKAVLSSNAVLSDFRR